MMPRPCKFISTSLPLCSVVRPTSTEHAGALAAAKSVAASGLFEGQSQAFIDLVLSLAAAADAAGGQPDE